MQPGESLEAKSCCWSPSCSVKLLAWVCLGGKWDVGWDLGSLRLGNCHGGVPAGVAGELFPETSPRSCVEGKSPGNGSMALRGVARVDPSGMSRGGDGHVPVPDPKSCGVQSPARGSPQSSLWAGKRVSRVLQRTVGCGMGQIQPHLGEEHGTGTKPGFPSSQGRSGSSDPIPCTQALGLPLCPTPHPGSTQAHGGTRVKSCPKLFLAVFQLGINGLGRQLGNASCTRPSPFVASPVSKFPLQTSIFQEFSNQPNDRCLELGAGSSPGPQP